MPESSVLEIALPSCFLDRDPPGEVRAVLREALEERLEEIYAERREAGLTAYMGADRVREQDPRASAGDVFPDFSLDPVLAGKVTEDRIEKIRTLQAWRGAYAIALEGWRGRKRRVVFPLGTYRMRVLHGVRVEQPAAPT